MNHIKEAERLLRDAEAQIWTPQREQLVLRAALNHTLLSIAENLAGMTTIEANGCATLAVDILAGQRETGDVLEVRKV